MIVTLVLWLASCLMSRIVNTLENGVGMPQYA